MIAARTAAGWLSQTWQLAAACDSPHLGRYYPRPLPALPGLDHVGNTDRERLRRLPGTQSIPRQHPITQILRIGPPSPPSHLRLRLPPEAYESHLLSAPEVRFQFIQNRSRFSTKLDLAKPSTARSSGPMRCPLPDRYTAGNRQQHHQYFRVENRARAEELPIRRCQQRRRLGSTNVHDCADSEDE